MKIHFKSVGSEFDPSNMVEKLPFVQSTPYFLWQKESGRDGLRFILNSDSKDKAFAQFFMYKLKKGIKILYSPLGIVSDEPITDEEYSRFHALLSDVAYEGGYSFIRLHSLKKPSGFFKALNTTRYSSFMQPQYDSYIKLKDPNDILSSISYGARRLIKKASKNLEFEVASVNDANLNDFINLLVNTSKRKGIKLHDREYYRNLFLIENTIGGVVKLFFAKYKGKRVATGLVGRSGSNSTYLFGGTDSEGLKCSSQYFLQFEIMKYEYNDGVKYYSFGGVAKDLKNKKDKLHKVTIFKKKFCGSLENYGDSYDLVNNRYHYLLYNIYNLLK